MIFVQRLTDLDNASAKLERLDYYVNYDPDDYRRLSKRQQRRMNMGMKKPMRKMRGGMGTKKKAARRRR